MVNVSPKSVQQEPSEIFTLVSANCAKLIVVHVRVNMIIVHLAFHRILFFKMGIVLSASWELTRIRAVLVDAKQGFIFLVSVFHANFQIALNVMMNFAILVKRTTS